MAERRRKKGKRDFRDIAIELSKIASCAPNEDEKNQKNTKQMAKRRYLSSKNH